jgi:hypothetical protein
VFDEAPNETSSLWFVRSLSVGARLQQLILHVVLFP